MVRGPMAVKFHDYYATLGVDRKASEEEIKRAYRKLARKYHPDVNKEAGAETKFKEINEANEVLGDPEKRKRYDALGANWKAGQEFDPSGGGGPQGWPGGFKVNRGGRAGRGGGGQSPFGGSADFSDFFESIFGGARGGGSPFEGDHEEWASRMRGSGGAGAGPQRGSDVRSEITLPLRDAALGSTRRVSLRDESGGTRTFEVKIPPGTTDGATIRLGGQGEAGQGGTAGDLLLTVRVAPDPRFEVDGRDLTTKVALAPWEAALGAKVPVPTLDGEVTLTIPGCSSCGKRLRLRGKGLPGRGGTPAGDLLAVIQIVLPLKLSAKEKEIYERLREASGPAPAGPPDE